MSASDESSSSTPAPQRSGELLIESGKAEATEQSERVLACDDQGGSLTLLEEYSLRRARSGKLTVFLSGLWAIISLAFACLTYFNT